MGIAGLLPLLKPACKQSNLSQLKGIFKAEYAFECKSIICKEQQ